MSSGLFLYQVAFIVGVAPLVLFLSLKTHNKFLIFQFLYLLFCPDFIKDFLFLYKLYPDHYLQYLPYILPFKFCNVLNHNYCGPCHTRVCSKTPMQLALKMLQINYDAHFLTASSDFLP